MLICFVFLVSTYKWNQTVFIFLYLTYFTLHNALHVVTMARFHSSFVAGLYSIVYIYVYTIYIHTHTQYLLYQFYWGTQVCLLFFFNILAIVNNTAVDKGVHIPFLISVFNFGGVNTQKWNCWIIWQFYF